MTRRTLNFLIPGDPETRTGGYIYDRRIVLGLRARGFDVRVERLSDRFPNPDAAALAAAEMALGGLPDGGATVIDGLAFGAMAEIAARHAGRLDLTALVHHPLAMETGLDPAVRDRLFRSERAALAHARRVVVTSPSTARALADYDVPPDRIAVVAPGVDPAPVARGSGGDGCALVVVGTVTPRKGHGVLIEALAGLRDLDWTLTCAGSLSRDAATATGVLKAIDRHRLSDRIVMAGEIDDGAMAALYDRADLLVQPSFHEGYGMALTEALARGLPVVATDAGAIAETVPAGAGMLVPPGDARALREALRQVITDPTVRQRLAAGARASRSGLPSWEVAAAAFARAVFGSAAS